MTRYVSDRERTKLYEFIRGQISIGRQAFVVCPLVEESEKIDLKAAETEVETLKKLFLNIRSDLIHGRLKPAEKDKVMSSFLKGDIKSPCIDHGHRGRDRCSECHDNADRAMRAVRFVTAPSIERPDRQGD